MGFSEQYGQVRSLRATTVHEGPDDVPEQVVQCVWYDQLFEGGELVVDDGRRLKVVSPGWWNHGPGPDFKGAQLEFNGQPRTGDVEIHLKHGDWRAHGHHLDARYDQVSLHVVLEREPPPTPVVTNSGKRVPTLLLPQYLTEDIRRMAEALPLDDFPYRVEGTLGHCAALVDAYGSGNLIRLIELAGEWRMVFKARALRERMDRSSANQAVYEAFLAASGYSHFKHHFGAIARQLHYDRARQLALEDAMLLEAAFLQLSGLLPQEFPEGIKPPTHFARLHALRQERLSGLRALPIEWQRAGIRPNNSPERRLAGAARFLSRVAKTGLVETLDECWAAEMQPIERRRVFEKLFPSPMGFWASHCTWTGKTMAIPSSLLGAGRVRSIIGNVFVPTGLAQARIRKDRSREDRVFEFFASLPQEPDNAIVKIMTPRLFGHETGITLNFRRQQGLLQMYHDWCEPNPSCRNCRVIRLLDERGGEAEAT